MLLLYNDDETSDCWSVFPHFITDDVDETDDDDDATFILKIHGMILEICTDPIEDKMNLKEIVIKQYDSTNLLNRQRKFLQ